MLFKKFHCCLSKACVITAGFRRAKWLLKCGWYHPNYCGRHKGALNVRFDGWGKYCFSLFTNFLSID